MDSRKRQRTTLPPHERIAHDYVISFRDRYHKRARYVRWFFRTSGTLVLGLSVTLPFLTSLHLGGHKNVVIGVIGVVIAFMASARNFFHWDSVWRIVRTTEFKLTELIGLWRSDVETIALTGGSDVEAQQLARTKKLIEAAQPVIEAESRDFFATLTWPDTSQPADK